QFPIPRRIELPGDVINYGYEDEVMLLAQVTPPGDWPAGKAIEFAADVSWLVCEKVCLPGKAAVKLSLPAGDSPGPANGEMFAKWTERIPARLDGSPEGMQQAAKIGIGEFGVKRESLE